MPVNIQNYFQRSVALLASQFQLRNEIGSLTNLQKMIQALTDEAQNLNTQEQLLANKRYLNTSEGVQLDGIGQILGLARIPGQSDYSYREALQFQVFLNQSDGTPEEMIYILKFLTDASKVWYIENYPASYQMATNGLYFPEIPSDLVTVIQESSPAGVEFSVLAATYNKVPFVFSSDPYLSQLYVAPNPNNIFQLNPFQVNPGSGLVDFSVQGGEVVNPDLGGGFAEAIGVYPSYTYDTTGAGQLVEAIQINGNIPPTP